MVVGEGNDGFVDDLPPAEALCASAQRARRAYLEGRYRQALRQARKTIALDRAAWQGWHCLALVLRKQGKLRQAVEILAQLARRYPEVHEIRQDLGDFVTKLLGDWQLAYRIWHPLQRQPEYARQRGAWSIKRQLYTGTSDPEHLSREIARFAGAYMVNKSTMRGSGQVTHAKGSRQRRKLGLIGTMFRASPVYYLTFGVIRELASEYDLIFFSRESVSDWATTALRSLASEWHDVQGMSVERLAILIRHQNLDVLLDLCGWLDLEVLQALAHRPSRRMYKWVGGQSASTGLPMFDGFISDAAQTPLETQSFYQEPLCLLESGYVTYTPPPYMPNPMVAAEVGYWSVGVVGHPMKVSSRFLAYLRREIRMLDADRPIHLQFIGWRYAHPLLQRRIQHAVFGARGFDVRGQIDLSFIPVKSHEDYLEYIAGLDWIIDTFPYTAGVTALEALALGVPIRTRRGTLCSERHAFSHCHYAGLTDESFLLDEVGAFAPPQVSKSAKSLLAEGCFRLNHSSVAHDLAAVLHM